jgi:two-component system CheB/CheR fusion protein
MSKQKKPTHKEADRGNVPSSENSSRKENRAFPIVGIGASAGGLEALEQFLRHVPENSGLAFVIVQHLDPTHIGIMAELLHRVTAMEVLQVKDRMRVKPDCVYVIPPNTDMSILHGVLHLFEPTAARGLRLPIDFFLCSLAVDRLQGSIGVILSGMGSDGTAGLRAIKENGGLTLAQEPTSAKYDSMPKNAIAAGLVDFVAPTEELPGKIIDYLHHAIPIPKAESHIDEKDQSALDKVLILLRVKTGHDFTMYKKDTVYRRIERRMSVHQINRIASYVRYLQENPQEVELLFKELLIGVTSFFRDPEVWERLRTDIMPELLALWPDGGMLRAWTPGCSTGEEAYSLAIVFKEALEQVKPTKVFTLQVFATDLSQDAIDKARRAVYPATIAEHMSPERLQRFFIKDGSGYRICREIRDMVTFATQNVTMHPPFTKLDLLICRNLLIYLNPEMQKKLIPLFHYSLNPSGVLLLGSSESINSFTDLFMPLNPKLRLFRRRDTNQINAPIVYSVPFVATLPINIKERPIVQPAANLQTLAEQLLLQRFSPAAVLTSYDGDILNVSGRTGKYLEPAAGKANMNIFAMAREGLRFDLNSAFQKAIRQKTTITVKGIKVGTNGGTQIVDITVQALDEPEAMRGMVMIVFNDVAMPLKTSTSERSLKIPAGKDGGIEQHEELRSLREELQTTREEMQSSHEELTSTNEELQSTNEELQSTNEELTTSREEMQSLNEELQTVNAEQQSKMEDLARVNDDMRNLLNSTEIITVFLDNKLNIRRFTPGADKLFKVIQGDVGRPLSDIVTNLVYPAMSEEALEVLRTLVYSEKQITTTDGRWFSVRIMPYRTNEDLIVGVVITFANITTAKKLEAELRQKIAELESLCEGRG